MVKASTESRQTEREALVAQLEVEGYITDPLLEEAMLAVPRHLFLPEDLREEAYEDRPLPVGFGQTVSAPHMVAMMTAALQLVPGQNVLEVGTGVGYHAAVVKAVVGPEGRVTSIEYLPELAQLAKANLKAAKADVEVHQGDGADGWPDGAPYDAALITCAVPQIPPEVIGQLREGGHIVAPVGVTRCNLIAGRKVDGKLVTDDLGACLFVNAQGRLSDLDDGEGPLAPAP